MLFFLAWIWGGVCLPRRYDIALLSLGWNFTRGRSQKKIVTATVVVPHLAQLCRKSTATGGEPKRVPYAWTSGRFRERTEAENFGLRTDHVLSIIGLGWGCTCTPQLASFESPSDTSMHNAARFSPVSTHSQLLYPRLWAVMIASVAFKFQLPRLPCLSVSNVVCDCTHSTGHSCWRLWESADERLRKTYWLTLKVQSEPMSTVKWKWNSWLW